jgi:calcium permeable stress-gated cation channel
LAAQSVLDPTPLRLVAHLAPAPNDIVWPNTYTTRRERLIRGWSITVISGIVSLLWATPIGALSGFLEPNYLAKVLPRVMDFLNSQSIIAVFVQGFLPTVMYTLFNGLAPFIFEWLSSWQGYISSADAELANVSKYSKSLDAADDRHFFYLFANFIIYLLFGSIANIWALAKDTTQIPHIIATKLPNFARFFINLIILQGSILLT